MAIISSSKIHIKTLIWTLLFLNCFGIFFLNYNFLNYIFTLILVIYTISNKNKTDYSKYIIGYSIFILFSCIYSSIYNHQNFIKVIGNSYNYLGLLFVFFIMKYKLSSNEIIQLIIKVSIIFCLCYIIQWIVYPTPIFSGVFDEVNIHDDVFRMRMSGSICAYTLFFYGLNQYILLKNKKFLLYSLLGFLPIILMGFRSLTVGSLICAFVMLPYITRSLKKTLGWILLGCISLIILSQTSIVQTKIDEMLERQNNGQTFENKDYIRYLEYDYYANYIFTKPGERFWGGGVPVFDGKTKYSKDIADSTETYFYYWVDLGLIGLSFIIGIPSVIILIIIIIRCIIRSKDKQLQFIRFTLLTVLLGSLFTTMEIYRRGNILIIALFLCLEYTKSQEINNYKSKMNLLKNIQ